MRAEPNHMIGGAVGVLMQTAEDKTADSRNPFLVQLNASIPAADYGAVLQEAVRKQLGAAQFTHITKVAVHAATAAEIEGPSRGNPDEQVLALDVRYYLAPYFKTLRVAMTARLGAREIVTASPSSNEAPSFVQEFYYDVPADRGGFMRTPRSGNAEYWTKMGGQAVGAQILAGMDEVMAMLAYELGRQPRFGRIPGKQIAWQEANQNSTYGVFERQVGDRQWLRLRNGRIASVPARAQ